MTSAAMRRVAGIASLAAVLALILASCGSKGRPTDEPSSIAAGATTSSAVRSSGSPAPTTTSTFGQKVQRVVARLLPATMPAPRYRTMGAALGDSMYLLGGIDAEGSSSAEVYRFSPASGQVAPAGTLAVPTHGAAAVSLGNRVLVFGGADVSPDDLVQSFDPATGTTTIIGHMPTDRADLTAALVNGRVILLGGFNGSTFVDDVWSTSDGRSFSVVGQLAQYERYPAIAVVGSTIYLFGGLVAGGEYDGTYSTAIQSFDVATGRSELVGHLPIPLAHARAAVVAGQVLVFGGWTTAGASSVIMRFDPQTGTVAPAGALPEAVGDEAIATIGDTVYFASGLGTAEHPLVRIGSITVTSSS